MRNLIVMDMDGTLLNSQKKISSKTKETLLKAEEKGDLLVLASGRGKSHLLEYAKELKMDLYNGYLIEANGSRIYDVLKEESETICVMSKEEADEIVTYLRKQYPDFEIVIMTNEVAYINTPISGEEKGKYNRHTIHCLKNRAVKNFDRVFEIPQNSFTKVCIYKDEEKILPVLKDIETHFSKRFWAGRVTPFWVEITPAMLNKGNALEILMKKLNIEKENVYVFGDGENDLSMLAVGHSIAMQNAFKHVQDACEFVTLSNEEDGIAHFIKEVLWKK